MLDDTNKTHTQRLFAEHAVLIRKDWAFGRGSEHFCGSALDKAEGFHYIRSGVGLLYLLREVPVAFRV
jgi:hypothetical protein